MKIINRDNRAYVFALKNKKQIIISGKNNVDLRNKEIVIMNGYAITEVTEEDWKAISEEYSYSHPIRAGLLYADKSESAKSALAFAKEHEKEAIHFAPITQEKMAERAKVQDISISSFGSSK